MSVDDFEVFIAEVRPRLARAFVAAYGPDRGEEALSEAMAVAWEQFDEIAAMAGHLHTPLESGATTKMHRTLEPTISVEHS